MENSVTALVEMFEEAENVTEEERKRNERDRDYYDGKQITTTERRTLQERGQPPVVYNRIRRKINYMLGLEKQTRKDPKCFPRNPNDQDAADAATDAIRFVCDAQNWDEVRSSAFENILIEGTGAVMVGAVQGDSGIDPSLIWVPWDRYFADPYSRKNDFSDASYSGIVTWYDVKDAVETWPEARDAIVATVAKASNDDTYNDKPAHRKWADNKRQRVRVIEMFYKMQGIWVTCTFTEGGHLVPPQISPYLDEKGLPENPLKAVSLYVDRENNRYGDVRDMIDPQDEVNKRRSKGLHLISMRQARIGNNSVMTPAAVKKELAKPDGVLHGDDIEILNTNDMAAQNFNLLQEAKNEIDLQGANAALQGKNEADQSGRAIMAQQQGGMIEIALHMDRLRVLSMAVYKAVWNRIKQFWTDERWVRVTDNDRNIRFVGFNQQVTVAQMMQEQLESDPQAMAALESDPMAQQRLQAFLQSPESQQVAEVRNNPSEIAVDIVIDEGLDTPSIHSEQWTELTKLAATGIVPIPPDVLVEASQLRNKDKLLEMLREPNPQQQQMQMQQAQLAEANAVAEIEKTQSETAKNMATAQATQASLYVG